MTDTRVRMVTTIRRDSFAAAGPNVWNSLRVCDQLEHVRNVLNRLRRLYVVPPDVLVSWKSSRFVSQKSNYCELRLENVLTT